MKRTRTYHHILMGCLWLAVVLLLALPMRGAGAEDESFAELQVGTHSYRNVTVTTKNTNYIFILHSQGMASIKVADLPEDVRIKLGFAPAVKPIAKSKEAEVWAKKTLAKLDSPQLQGVKQELSKTLGPESIAKAKEAFKTVKPRALYGSLAISFLVYLFFCFCCRLICIKAGKPPGVLIWLPVLNWIPLFRAAGMSAWWFVALFVPLLSFVPLLIWPFKIAKARGKGVLAGIFLLLPFTNILAFLYLALSDGGSSPEGRGNQPLSLAAA